MTVASGVGTPVPSIPSPSRRGWRKLDEFGFLTIPDELLLSRRHIIETSVDSELPNENPVNPTYGQQTCG